MNVDRLPPHSPDAELGILGCIFTDPRVSLDFCEESLPANEDVFYDLRHSTIFKAFRSMRSNGIPIDTITTVQFLKDAGHLDEVGGAVYIASLPDFTPSAANIEYYVAIVKEKFLLRKMIHCCTETVSRIYDFKGEVHELVDRFESDALKLRGHIETLQAFVDIRATQQKLVNDYEAASKGGLAMGILSGYPDLDRVAGGMMPQEMIVVAGLRSTGKTTLAMNIAHRVAKDGMGVGIVSLETSGEKLVHRMLAGIGQYDASLLLRGIKTEGLSDKTMLAFDGLKKFRDRVFIDESGAMTGPKLSAKGRRMVNLGAKLLIVDYLQLLIIPGKSEYERVTGASRTVKNLAKELKVPVIVVASLSRESDRDSRAPKLSDLRASGQIEYDADKVILLHSEDEGPVRTVTANVAKNKDGNTAKVQFTFFASQFRMESVAHVDSRDVPKPRRQHND